MAGAARRWNFSLRVSKTGGMLKAVRPLSSDSGRLAGRAANRQCKTVQGLCDPARCNLKPHRSVAR